jgi:hypothetical protein
MGDADEGTECVAILAGEGYGHQSKVIGCVSRVQASAWHG